MKSCGGFTLIPGMERDGQLTGQSGITPVEWTHAPVPGGVGTIDGIPFYKPPYGRITAIDMNTGEILWWIPNGETPERISNHPLLEGVELPNTGQPSHATAVATGSLLIYGEGRGGLPRMHAVDKRTGESVGTVELPAPTDTAPMTFLHEGVQYIVTAVSGQGSRDRSSPCGCRKAGRPKEDAMNAKRLPAGAVWLIASLTAGCASGGGSDEIGITPFVGASVQLEYEGTVIHVDPFSRETTRKRCPRT